jgi:hypothetical protein
MTDITITPSPLSTEKNQQKIYHLDELIQKLIILQDDITDASSDILRSRKEGTDTEDKEDAYAAIVAKTNSRQDRIYNSIKNTILSIDDFKELSSWLSDYIDTLGQYSKKSYYPNLFNTDFPFEFWNQLDVAVSQKAYKFIRQLNDFTDADMKQYYPNLSKFISKLK